MIVDSDEKLNESQLDERLELSQFKEPVKHFACLLVPTLIKAYRGTENWESRKLIVAVILNFVLYLDKELMCEILQVRLLFSLFLL